MKVIVKSNNAGYGESTLTYEGPFVGTWQIACFLKQDIFTNEHYDEPRFKSVEDWHEFIKGMNFPFEMDGLVCEGGGSMPDYAKVTVRIEE